MIGKYITNMYIFFIFQYLCLRQQTAASHVSGESSFTSDCSTFISDCPAWKNAHFIGILSMPHRTIMRHVNQICLGCGPADEFTRQTVPKWQTLPAICRKRSCWRVYASNRSKMTNVTSYLSEAVLLTCNIHSGFSATRYFHYEVQWLALSVKIS